MARVIAQVIAFHAKSPDSLKYTPFSTNFALRNVNGKFDRVQVSLPAVSFFFVFSELFFENACKTLICLCFFSSFFGEEV